MRGGRLEYAPIITGRRLVGPLGEEGGGFDDTAFASTGGWLEYAPGFADGGGFVVLSMIFGGAFE